MSLALLTAEAIIAKELQVRPEQVIAAVQLLDEGATVPFIARYRKEVTGGLDDTQLRFLDERLGYLRELNERRQTILNSIREQEKLTPELEQAILQAETKTKLEDLYLPYKPKRRTKAQIAIEAGLEPLALSLWENPDQEPETLANQFLNAEAGFADAQQTLEGARQILMEKFSENAQLLEELREYLWQHGLLQSSAQSKKVNPKSKFADYFSYSESIKKIPSHRALALFRGRRENELQLTLNLPEASADYGTNRIAAYFKIENQGRPADPWLLETVKLTWMVKLFTKLELELFTRLRENADEEAIKVFANNLRDLLLAAPAGPKVTLGLDPGIRTGVKVVVADVTGKVLDYCTIYPLPPQNDWHQSIADLAKLIIRHNVTLISIGNGTGSRETERLVSELIKMYPDLKLTKVVVSEAGASVYSASELAAKEFPDLDVSIRGAVSIARRIQDPLAELVKIEPKAIGVGQYQHDVNQNRLAKTLTGVVEDCVNAVGVDLNTASAPLLTRISGLNEGLAQNIVKFREEHGAFHSREQLKQVERLGEKTYQQAAGFLRIMHGDNPLDASAVHPEAYPLVQSMVASLKVEIKELIGNKELLKSIKGEEFVNENFGLPTIRDVLVELEKPGRDPRPEFRTAQFKEGIEEISHLQTGMILEGVVSNVTNFGAFVDIGVHQDGLVHISELNRRYVNDPRSVVKAGDIIKIRVIEVDLERKRIGLSMKLEEDKTSATEKKPYKKPEPQGRLAAKPKSGKNEQSTKPAIVQKKAPVFNTSMADAFAKLKLGAK